MLFNARILSQNRLPWAVLRDKNEIYISHCNKFVGHVIFSFNYFFRSCIFSMFFVALFYYLILYFYIFFIFFIFYLFFLIYKFEVILSLFFTTFERMLIPILRNKVLQYQKIVLILVIVIVTNYRTILHTITI